MQLKYTASLLLSSALALGLGACSSNSDSDSSGMSSVLTGYFLDARVKGLQYTSTPSGRTGVTNAQGEFEYIEGDTVTFKLGNGTPISIGTVTAKPVVQVTEMPQFLALARTLQTLDTDQDADIIDVGQITMPAAINTALASLLSDGQGDIDTVLSDANIQAIEDASQPASGSADPAVDLINTSVVSTSDAIDHVSENISEDYTTADLARQVYKRLGDGGDAEFMYISTDGSGVDYWDDPDTGTESDSFSWLINADKDAVFTYGDGAVTASLLSVEGNKYIVSAIDTDQTESDVVELIKAKPLSITALDGKIFRRVSPDEDCAAQTFKFTGSTFEVKESCGVDFHQISGNLSESSDFDNSLVISGTSPNGNAFSVLFSLMEGEIADGSQMKWATLDTVQTHFEEITYELTDAELEVPAGFTTADLSRQVYVSPDNGFISAFKNDGTGTEFNAGDGSAGSASDTDFTWNIDTQGRAIVDYSASNEGIVTAALTSVSGNNYTLSSVNSTDPSNPSTPTLKRALPLTLADLDGKIVSFDMSEDSDCTAITLKFTGTDVRDAEVCSDVNGGQRVQLETAAQHADFDNVIVITEPDGDVSLMALTSGDVNSSGTFAIVNLDDDGTIDWVDASIGFNIVSQEAVPDTSSSGFTSADFSRQVYVEPGDDMILAFGSGGSGIEFNDGNGANDSPEDSDFTWSVDSQGELLVDYGVSGNVTVVSNGLTGNTLNVIATDSDDPNNPEPVAFKKALPLTLADLDGKIISVDASNDSDCSAITVKFTGTAVRDSKVCSSGGSGAVQATAMMHPDYDNVAVITYQSGFISMFSITSGDVSTSGTLANILLNSDSSVDSVDGSVGFTIVNQEAVPE